ncbi:hypothetical protein ACXJJ3_18410 [Kribbella sp. WER1]
MKQLPVARSRDEARLYLDLTACDCGAIDADWQHATGLVDEQLASMYDATCPECGADREYAFALPDHESAGEYPDFGGAEPSELIDPGRWLALADHLAANLPADDPTTVGEALRLAVATVDEVLKFIPPGATAVPAAAFWSAEGQAIYTEDPARFTGARLEIIRSTWRRLAAAEG